MEQIIKDWEKEWKSPGGKRRLRFSIPMPNGKSLAIYMMYSEKDRLNPEYEFDDVLMKEFKKSMEQLKEDPEFQRMKEQIEFGKDIEKDRKKFKWLKDKWLKDYAS